jgi:hypothetical protein
LVTRARAISSALAFVSASFIVSACSGKNSLSRAIFRKRAFPAA